MESKKNNINKFELEFYKEMVKLIDKNEDKKSPE